MRVLLLALALSACVPSGKEDHVVALMILPDSQHVTRYTNAAGGLDSIKPDSLNFCAWVQYSSGVIVPYDSAQWHDTKGNVGPTGRCWRRATATIAGLE